MDIEGIFFNTSDYSMSGKKLGNGTSGNVYLVTNKNDGKQYAAKIINIGEDLSGNIQMQLMRESMILFNLSHPAIIKFYGANFHSFDNPLQLKPTILMEFISNGSFGSFLEKEKCGLADKNWDSTKKYIILLGIADAMRYLHEHGVLHRDLKPDNILIDENYYPHICDFGYSHCFSENLLKKLKLTIEGQIGTPMYMAPELFDENGNHFNFGIDVYAFAIIAYQTIACIDPYSVNGKSITFSELIQKVQNGERPEFNSLFSEPMKELISRCWSQNIDERPPFNEIFYELKTQDLTVNEGLNCQPKITSGN